MDIHRVPVYASLAWIAVLVSACLLMLFVLQPGLPVSGDPITRIMYIQENVTIWRLGWYSWMLSAVGLLMFALFLKAYVHPGSLVNIGIALVGIGVLPDLAAEHIFKDILSKHWDISQAADIARFEEYEMLATQLTGTIANGAYNIGGLCLNAAMFANPNIPRWLTLAGIPAWILGLGLSLATANAWMDAAYWFTASAMTLSILWCTSVILILFMQPERYMFRKAPV